MGYWKQAKVSLGFQCRIHVLLKIHGHDTQVLKMLAESIILNKAKQCQYQNRPALTKDNWRQHLKPWKNEVILLPISELAYACNQCPRQGKVVDTWDLADLPQEVKFLQTEYAHILAKCKIVYIFEHLVG